MGITMYRAGNMCFLIPELRPWVLIFAPGDYTECILVILINHFLVPSRQVGH